MELIRLPEAARQLGVSYPTLKQWIYKRKIRSVRTAGGHHRILRAEIDRLLFRAESDGHGRAGKGSRQEAAGRLGIGLEQFISGRNQLVGRVISVRVEGLLAEVHVDVGGANRHFDHYQPGFARPETESRRNRRGFDQGHRGNDHPAPVDSIWALSLDPLSQRVRVLPSGLEQVAPRGGPAKESQNAKRNTQSRCAVRGTH